MRELLSCEGHFKESELSGTGQTHWLFITATCMSDIGSQEMGLRIFVDC